MCRFSDHKSTTCFIQLRWYNSYLSFRMQKSCRKILCSVGSSSGCRQTKETVALFVKSVRPITHAQYTAALFTKHCTQNKSSGTSTIMASSTVVKHQRRSLKKNTANFYDTSWRTAICIYIKECSLKQLY
jgi:hypothetical protein